MNCERARVTRRAVHVAARRMCSPSVPLFLFTVHCLLFTPSLPAQIAEEQQDTVSDTLETDSVSVTERFLKEQLQVNIRVPVLPMVGIEGPRPALTRIVFTRDSI